MQEILDVDNYFDKKNCPNCGMPYEKDKCTCPFCGTLYLDLATFEVGEPVYIKIKCMDKIYLFHSYLNSVSVECLAINEKPEVCLNFIEI